MSKISILGCGWLGLPLGDELTKKGYDVNGSTTTSHKLKKIERLGIKPYFIDLSPEFSGDPSFFSCETLVINIPPRNRDSDDHFHEKQLLSIRSEVKSKKVSHVLFVSSTAVYPNTNSKVTEEDASAESLSRGGVPLLKMENLFKEDDSFETTVLRFGGLYGPDRNPAYFLAGKKNLGGGTNPVNMIHRDDCIGIIEQIIKEQIWGEVFNACSPNKPSRKEFYLEAAKSLGVEPPEFSDEPQDYKDVSSQKLIDRLGYRFLY
ncbi:SDR family NAD(P)-dependent oxidoreductase [Marinoscillum sp.]|uniref:SDR family NAD(P)-dependent oxidoreductase n=1 Tax=Marinoscillum sp. TaxID=2024838 RepID=UPI003BA9757F